jgi:hypothetical protein
MKTRSFLALLLVSVILANSLSPILAADTLVAGDFALESWAKNVDYFDYARAFATLHDMVAPPDSWHANVYMTYVNTNGMQVLYSGLSNITANGLTYLTIPMQAFMMHYKTENKSRDVIVASTFLMLLAFNETGDSIHADSPDRNDTLWASFSLGFNFPDNSTLPALSSKATTIPLTSSADKLRWSWGMRYTNLTAVWWRTWTAPNNHTYNSLPFAITVYDELTFTYNLTISPTTHTAVLTENHVIGRMRDLWRFWGWFIIPLVTHYNSTGAYFLGSKISNETVYDFIQKNQIKMSIVNFQTSIMADHKTVSRSSSGENVTDSENDVGNSSITTYADDGERVFGASFGTKQTYDLYNYTSDTWGTYNATTRTSKIDGFAKNAGLFVHHINFLKFLPLLVVNMYPQLYAQAKANIANMTRANYFYITAYPVYSGYKVVHDPTFTAYFTATAAAPDTARYGLFILIVAVVAVGVAVVLMRRRKKPADAMSTPPPPPS